MHPADDYGFFSDYACAVGITILGVEEIPIAFFKTKLDAGNFFAIIEDNFRCNNNISNLRQLIAKHSGDIIDLDEIQW
jgi:hypothetical protein